METRETARFAVVISRETREDWTISVTADSREDACEQADAIVANCMFPEFEMIESDYHFDANLIDAWHHAESRPERTMAARWSAASASTRCSGPAWPWTAAGTDPARPSRGPGSTHHPRNAND